MAEYTYKDVIIDPTSEEAKNAIGKEAYYSDNPTECLEYANNDDKYHLERFNSIEKYNCPFNFGDFNYSCLIVKKKEPYAERAKKWIEDNGLKKGDYVKVTRTAENYEDGWNYVWDSRMDNSVGKILRVEEVITYKEYIVLEDSFGYPYFVLEKVEKDELYSEHLKRWIEDNNVKAGDYVRVTRTIDYDDENFNAAWTDEMDRCAGKTMRVLKVDDYSGITLENLCIFPYFVLEKVEEPKPKYVPFKSKEEFIEAFHYHDVSKYSDTDNILLIYGMWLKCKESSTLFLVTMIKDEGLYTEHSYYVFSWENVLTEYEFLDGTPCGRLVEDIND